jgi:hypothetical protein
MNLNPQQDGTTLFIPIPKWVGTCYVFGSRNIFVRNLYYATSRKVIRLNPEEFIQFFQFAQSLEPHSPWGLLSL